MEEINFAANLFSQAPGIAGVLIVVFAFLRALEKRDTVFAEQMSRITERLTALERLMADHDTQSRTRGDTLERLLVSMNGSKTKRDRNR